MYGDSCWYKHDVCDVIPKKPFQEDYINNRDDKQPAQNAPAQSSGFWETPANLAPPSNLPRQATWIRMVTMMTELNQMMKNMKNQSPFRSL